MKKIVFFILLTTLLFFTSEKAKADSLSLESSLAVPQFDSFEKDKRIFSINEFICNEKK